jgi:hypothetical protein
LNTPSIIARMFESNNRKRPSARYSDPEVRLKKPYKILDEEKVGSQLPDICAHDRFVEQRGVNHLSPTTCFTPLDSGITADNYIPHPDKSIHHNESLLALFKWNITDESTLLENPWSENDEESPDEDLSSKDKAVVPRVCFGVVSCSHIF